MEKGEPKGPHRKCLKDSRIPQNVTGVCQANQAVEEGRLCVFKFLAKEAVDWVRAEEEMHSPLPCSGVDVTSGMRVDEG